MGVYLVVLGFAAVDGFHVRGISQPSGSVLLEGRDTATAVVLARRD
jgi:hypothetical protein